MAKHTVKAKARYQLRGDTAAALEAVNPTLKSKEPVLVLNETKTAVAFKIGDGVTPYAELPLHSFDVDQTLDENSARAIANKVVTAIFNELADIRAGADDNTYDTAGDAVRYQLVEIKQSVASAGSAASELDRRLTLEVEPAVAENAAKIGDVESALDGILAIQNALIGGAAE